MPLEDILSRIRDESSQAAREIIDDAGERAQKRLDEARAQAQAQAATILEDAKAQASKLEAMAKTRADATRRQLLLKEKQALIESVFSRAGEVLASIPAAEYRGVILNSLARSVGGGETVVLGPEDKNKIGDDFASEVNRSLASSGKSGVKVQFAEKSLGGGYILLSGGISENATFPALVKRFMDELEIEVARKLFAGS